MDIKKIIKQELKEATVVNTKGKVTGDAGATNIAAGEDALGRVEKRLQKLGVYDVPSLDGIMTVEQLSIEPFEFDFVLQVPEVQQELSLPKPPRFSTLARVVNGSPFILEVKEDGKEETFTIQFDNNEMVTNLPGTKKGIIALKTESRSGKGKFYNVILSKDFLKVATNNKGGGEEEVGGKDGKKGGDGKGDGKNNKEGLFKDLSGFFKFVVNNKKFLSSKPNSGEPQTQESIFDDIEKLLLEADVNPSEEKPENTKNYKGRIYIKDITLGPKAEKRRAGDVQNYANTTGGGGSFDFKKWSGEIKDLPPSSAVVSVDISDPVGLNPEQKKVFNEIKTLVKDNATIRPSKKGDKTTFVVAWGNKAFVGEVSDSTVNLRKKPEIEIGRKASGDDIFLDPFKAKIQISEKK
jgi:hypothetical protein